MPSFEEQINQFVDKTQQKLLNVARQAISDVIEESQTPVAKGGRMRVDTGFLRSSGVAALEEIPSGPTEGRKRAKDEIGELYKIDGTSVNIALAKMKIGQTFFFGWTAKYAKVRETYDGFLEAALQKWQNTVDIAIKKFES